MTLTEFDPRRTTGVCVVGQFTLEIVQRASGMTEPTSNEPKQKRSPAEPV